MAEELIVPDQLTRRVPGQLTANSPAAVWDGVSVRGHRHAGSDVEVPPLRDCVVVAYRRGRTSMRCRIGGEWIHETLGPGDVSLPTRAAESHWVWPEDVEVVHVHLTQDELAATGRKMYERDVQEVELHDTVKADDPAVHRTALQITHEATQGAAGSGLMVDSLSCQLAVHILRRHAHVLFRERGGTDGLTFRQDRAVRDYIHQHLGESISLADLADEVGLSRFHFARRFRATTGTPPHEFVIQERVAKARTMLEHSNTPLQDIACACGFADQSHMTREFKKRVGATPGRYRSRSR
ncbi:AraC family transcriptional regulator [uncultured Arthrobacter sp.]|uniref:AraC family transcriptional regulator n=1 Tax=uncultured Arthrobacter sp. TaxID=114050 RepID=UPI0025FCB42A|nr:AraC family transcriptional regulator [uncultured Arthrobacter sp.]